MITTSSASSDSIDSVITQIADTPVSSTTASSNSKQLTTSPVHSPLKAASDDKSADIDEMTSPPSSEEQSKGICFYASHTKSKFNTFLASEPESPPAVNTFANNGTANISEWFFYGFMHDFTHYIDTLHLQMFTIASIFSFLNKLLETQNLFMPHNTIQGNLQCSGVHILFIFLQILP